MKSSFGKGVRHAISIPLRTPVLPFVGRAAPSRRVGNRRHGGGRRRLQAPLRREPEGPHRLLRHYDRRQAGWANRNGTVRRYVPEDRGELPATVRRREKQG